MSTSHIIDNDLLLTPSPAWLNAANSLASLKSLDSLFNNNNNEALLPMVGCKLSVNTQKLLRRWLNYAMTKTDVKPDVYGEYDEDDIENGFDIVDSIHISFEDYGLYYTFGPKETHLAIHLPGATMFFYFSTDTDEEALTDSLNWLSLRPKMKHFLVTPAELLADPTRAIPNIKN